MKSKELFMLIDQIDKRFVEEAWEGSEDSGNAIEVVLERSPFHAVKFAAAVAACIVMFGAGFFTIANIRASEPFQPSSSGAAESPDSLSESEISSNTSSEDSSSENSNMSSGDSSNSGDVSSIVDFDGSNEFYKQGVYKLEDMIIVYGDIRRTEVVEKTDNFDYAVIYVDETDATEEQPIIATIYSIDEFGNIDDAISETLYITGRGKYGFYYTVPRGAGSRCVLSLENDFKELHDEKYDLRIVGSWTP